jgi:O-succinylbenzoic acid--CoA ligase
MCPLKEAARDAPNQLAVLSKEFSFTFKELDTHVDTVGNQSPFLFAQMFAAWRKETFFFPTNPRLPNPPFIQTAPPQSLLLLTSGSTGTPKIAILPMKSLLANAEGAIGPLDLRPNDQWKLNLPLYHVGGIGVILRCILARATIVLDESPNITHISCVPTHLYRATPIYKNLRCLLVGGAPIPSYPFPIFRTYGLTEMGSMVTLNGKVLPNREVKLGSDGEIWVRGPCLFQGYLNEPMVTDWFATKDLGKMENGQLEILGRKDWMFISGGENIQPEEIEAHLLQIPDVIDAVVLPKEDPEFGKRPIAVVSAHRVFSLSEMQTILAKVLPKFKIPIALHFIDEIPKQNNLKTDRLFISQLINGK